MGWARGGSEETASNSLESGMTQHETTTTVYSDGSMEIDTLVVEAPRGRASGSRSARHEKKVRNNKGALAATLTISGSWKYDTAKNIVFATSKSSSKKAKKILLFITTTFLLEAKKELYLVRLGQVLRGNTKYT